uniref:Vitamin K-dependent gamma-carboxylase n=2 Tax=Biomphalaria glabrata TaxID=6526 RepID=A0A2C9JGW2_BIOGL
MKVWCQEMLRRRIENSGSHETHIKNQERDKAANSGCHKSESRDIKHDSRSIIVYGFQLWEQLVGLLCQPSDPACLGIVRIIFGFLMVIDTLMERGMSLADGIWGNVDTCRFPLFSFLQPLPLEWMCLVYMAMLVGAVGILIGFKFRYSCSIYLVCYWYIFFLEKTAWNNHSYLFGIIAFHFFMSDANRYCSLDGLLKPSINNAHIPYWNYFLMQAQIFLVYFIAGLKKLDHDWVFGYSMRSLSVHWVFMPFKLFLSDEKIDLIIVHLGGLFIDLFVGFLLFINKTKSLGLLISTSFHFMNSQIFPIGMFPYVMLTTNLLFCSPSWPRKLSRYIPNCFSIFLRYEQELQPSSHCVYQDHSTESNVRTPTGKDLKEHSEMIPPTKPSFLHQAVSVFTILFLALQCFLPYSHGITKGYNNWTNGLYGYSWDMMVHRWKIQHVRISYHNKDTGDTGYLDPMVWSYNNRRWAAHGDMIKQYAVCIARNLQKFNVSNVELYFDIWQSLNGRFQQRMVNPNVDILTAEWSPFETPSYIMPLIVDLSNWREKLDQMEAALINDNNKNTNVIFMADFPGLMLENYVQPDFSNTTLTVLKGRVIVELEDFNITVKTNESLQIPADVFHKVYTVSETPSCFMYLFVNTTQANLNYSDGSVEERSSPEMDLDGDDKEETSQTSVPILGGSVKHFFKKISVNLHRSLQLGLGALWCIATRSSFNEFLNSTYKSETTK